MAKLKHFKVIKTDNKITLFSVTINGKTFDCTAKNILNMHYSSLCKVSTGTPINMAYFWGGQNIQDSIDKLLLSGVGEWSAN